MIFRTCDLEFLCGMHIFNPDNFDVIYRKAKLLFQQYPMYNRVP